MNISEILLFRRLTLNLKYDFKRNHLLDLDSIQQKINFIFFVVFQKFI